MTEPLPGPLMQVWALVRQAQGAVTLSFLVEETGLEPDLVQSVVDWLARQGRLQKVGRGEVCAVPQSRFCRWCAWRARCPVAAQGPEGAEGNR